MANSPRSGGTGHGPVYIKAQHSAVAFGDNATASNSVQQLSSGIGADDIAAEVAALLKTLVRMIDDGVLQANGLDGQCATEAVCQLDRINEELDEDSPSPGVIRRAVDKLVLALAGVEAVSVSVDKIVGAARSVFGGP